MILNRPHSPEKYWVRKVSWFTIYDLYHLNRINACFITASNSSQAIFCHIYYQSPMSKAQVPFTDQKSVYFNYL